MSEELKKEKENIQDNNQESLEVNLSDETTQQENDQQPGDEEGQPKAEPTTEEQLEAAKKEIEDLNDKLLRKIAEFDNYRKRTMKEKTELILNGGERTVVAILPVIDDLERALKNMKQADDIAAVVEGVELDYKKRIDTPKKQGVEPIQTEGADFDVDLHAAIAQLPAPTDELKGKVMDCTLTGYKMNEKVIRHSQVVVGL